MSQEFIQRGPGELLPQKGCDPTVILKIKNLPMHFFTSGVLNIPMELAAKVFQELSSKKYQCSYLCVCDLNKS